MSEETQEKSYRGLHILRGARHCKIIDVTQGDSIVFRTTNVRDAEEYLELVEERDRLQVLLDSRGIAPHRIYLLPIDEPKQARAPSDGAPKSAAEVVIVAKAGHDTVVVRHLSEGREEIVELDDLEPIEGGAYLQGPELADESVHVVVRYDREAEQAAVCVSRDASQVETILNQWSSAEAPGGEYLASIEATEGDVALYRADVSIED